MLYLISLGLFDKNDISLRAIEKAKQCDILYYENYTSFYHSDIKELEDLFNKPIKELSRQDVEDNSNKLIEECKLNNIGVLVIGDCLTATTHISLLLEAKKNQVGFEVIHGSSIFTAIGETGLSVYNFGKIVSIPFDNKNIKVAAETVKFNLENNMHSLLLLDLDPSNNRSMSFKEGLNYLISNGFSKEMKVLVCSFGKLSIIKYGSIKRLMKADLEYYPQSIIIPSNKLHFMEEEFLKSFEV